MTSPDSPLTTVQVHVHSAVSTWGWIELVDQIQQVGVDEELQQEEGKYW